MGEAQHAAPVLTGPQIQALLRAIPDRDLWLQSAAADESRTGIARRGFHAELRALRRGERGLQRAYASLLWTPGAGPDGGEGQDHG